jgi:hypothetical protein
MNVTALADGFYALTEPRQSGFGPTVWVGELRDAAGRPFHDDGDRSRLPMTMGPTESGVIAVLARRARHHTLRHHGRSGSLCRRCEGQRIGQLIMEGQAR